MKQLNSIINKLSNILVVSDNYYHLNSCEVEYLSDRTINGTYLNYINITAYLDNRKLPLYPKYQYIIIEEKYFMNKSLFYKLEYLLDDNYYLYIVFKDINDFNNNNDILTYIENYQYSFYEEEEFIILIRRK